jgi:elongation factor G
MLTTHCVTGSGTHSVNVTISLSPDGSTSQPDLKLDHSADSAANLANLHPRQLLAIKRGVEAGMSHGPLLSCPVSFHAFQLYCINLLFVFKSVLQ